MFNFLRKRKIALAFIKEEKFAQYKMSIERLKLEKLDKLPYPLRLAYSSDQTVTAVHQRVVRRFTEIGLSPPRNLKTMVEAACRAV